MELTRRRWGIRLLFTAEFILVFSLSAMWTVRFLVRRGEEVAVPQLMGKGVAEAESVARAADLRLGVAGAQYSEKYPEGAVLHQDLPPNDKVRAGRVISVLVSRGPQERNAPRVTGLERSAAELVVKSSDLELVDGGTGCTDGFPAGTVAAQDPPPGGPVSGSRIRVLISSGACRDRYVMPALEGIAYRDAAPEFERKGFVARFIRHTERADAAPGSILGTDPPAGAMVRSGDAVTFEIASAPDEEPVPASETRLLYVNLRSSPGFSRPAARLWLERGSPELSYAIDFHLTPGENSTFVLFFPSGSEVVFSEGGREIWRRTQ